MHRINLCIIFFYFLSILIYSQVETIPADHPVYPFLKSMFIKGVLENYDDVILPLSKQQVIDLLKKIESRSGALTLSQREFLFRMETKIGMKDTIGTSYFNNFPDDFFSEYKVYNEKHLYTYKDSTAKLNVDLSGDITPIYTDKYKDYSILLNAGGQIYGTYSRWLGFLIEGSNGSQIHNRKVAELDPRVKSSYTFNHTGINFFDFTQGYVRLQKDDVSLELGRERILWGTGYINKMILSDNPPLFDFLRFHISYKTLRYDFLHAWLIQPYDTFFVDTLTQYAKVKDSKYLAISRLGFTPVPELKLGLSQMIIYANRPFEVAYLNPFLFWESAQRSQGDLDNSFLTLDAGYKVCNGIETSGSIIFDDILFNVLFKGEFNKVNNRSAWQAGVDLTDPIMPSNTSLKIEYLQIRPYTFSHPGIGQSLTYTTNSYLLGTNLQPNSSALSAQLNYLLCGNIQFEFKYMYVLHGKNYHDSTGKLIRNVGGNVFENLNIYDSLTAPLLDGDLETIHNFLFSLQDEIFYGVYLNLLFNASSTKSYNITVSQYSILTQLKLYFR